MNSTQQIVVLYEDIADPMSIEDICAATDLDETSVRMALLQGSVKYNKELQNNQAEFPLADKEMAKMVMKQLMMSSESPQVRARMARFIYEESIGRNDTRSLKGANINVTLFNQTLQDVEKAEKIAVGKVIDVDPRHKHLKEIAV